MTTRELAKKLMFYEMQKKPSDRMSIDQTEKMIEAFACDKSAAFADWLWSDACANEYVNIAPGRWGKEKDGSIELQLQEYTTTDMYEIFQLKSQP